jgi:Flp pilus assembly protein TadG
MRMSRRNRRRKKGQSLIEAMIGFMVLIPIGLAAVNVVCLVSTSQTNEQWAEIAARAAATRTDQGSAMKAATEALSDLERNQIIEDVQISSTDFNLATGHVTVFTSMKVKLPVPIPGFSEVNCAASSIQPIVSTPAPR